MVLPISSSSAPWPDAARSLASDSPSHRAVGGISIFNGDLDQAARLCFEWIETGEGGRIATANLDFMALARTDSELNQLLAASHLVVADGAPVAWLARLSGGRFTRRIGGVDLVTELLQRGSARGALKVALYGATESVAFQAKQEVERRFANVRVVSVITPPFRDRTRDEAARDCDELRAADPELVLVALGCPKQERLIERYFDAVPSAVWIGVGGTLDILTGRQRRAPRFVQRAGFEWAVRLAQEPRRLWRRYVLRDFPTLLRLAPHCAWTGLRHAAGIRGADGRISRTAP